MPIVGSSITTHRTFMDTLGRPTLRLTALNLVDEWRDRDLIVRLQSLGSACMLLLHCINVIRAGHVRLPLDSRLTQTSYNLRRRVERVRHRMGDRKHRHQHWEEKGIIDVPIDLLRIHWFASRGLHILASSVLDNNASFRDTLQSSHRTSCPLHSLLMSAFNPPHPLPLST